MPWHTIEQDIALFPVAGAGPWHIYCFGCIHSCLWLVHQLQFLCSDIAYHSHYLLWSPFGGDWHHINFRTDHCCPVVDWLPELKPFLTATVLTDPSDCGEVDLLYWFFGGASDICFQLRLVWPDTLHLHFRLTIHFMSVWSARWLLFNHSYL